MASPQVLCQDNPGLAISFDSVAGLPRPKRQKTTVACEICRLRKSKCDGVRPTCGPCSKRGTLDACIYTRRQSRDTIASSTELYSLTPAASRARRTTDSPPAVGTNMPSGNDAMGNIDNWAVRVGLFGASSSASFMQHVTRILDGTKTPEPDLRARGVASGHASTRPFYKMQAKSERAHSPEYVLPPRRTANLLLKIHWNCSQIIFPWVDRLGFMKQYETLWTDHRDSNSLLDEQVFYCILNIIFALSYKIDSSIDSAEQETLSNAHFSRAQKLLSFNLLEISHIGMVQALLLMAQYLQSTNMPRQCFQCVSLGIWIAQEIGLDMPETLLPFQNQHEREIARRVWYGCILMDRVTAMTFGRPMRIRQEIAKVSPLPAAIDDEFLDHGGSEDGIQPIDQTSQLQFYVAYCELHIILGDILSVFYTARMQSGHCLPGDQFHKDVSMGGEHVDKLLQFEKALDQWREKLGPHHQVDSGSPSEPASPVFRRQAVSLQARFLHIRTLLYRPFFSKQPATSKTSLGFNASFQLPQLADNISSHGIIACVQAAQNLIDLLSAHLSSDDTSLLLPPWWHVISYIYTAGTVLIAAHLFQSVVDHISQPNLSASVSQAFASLQHFEGQRQSAQLCKSALEHLYSKIFSRKKSRHLREESVSGPGTSGQPGTAEIELSTDFLHHNSDLDFYDGTEWLWLNSAPFNSDMNFWT